MLRRVGSAMVTAVAVFAVSTAVLSSPAAADTVADEQGFVARINQLRSSKGLGSLSVDGELTAIGRQWAAQMSSAGAISHNPNFSKQVQADWAKLGENVGVGNTVDSLMTAFINSPGHFANLVDPAFTHIGVGVVRGGDGRMYTSHQFMKLRSGAGTPAAPAPTVTKPPTTAAPKVASAPKPAATKATAPAAPTAKPTASTSATPGRKSLPAAVKLMTPRLKHSLDQLRDLDPAA